MPPLKTKKLAKEKTNVILSSTTKKYWTVLQKNKQKIKKRKKIFTKEEQFQVSVPILTDFKIIFVVDGIPMTENVKHADEEKIQPTSKTAQLQMPN